MRPRWCDGVGKQFEGTLTKISEHFEKRRTEYLLSGLLLFGISLLIIAVNSQTRPWWIGDLVTVTGIIIGAIVIIYQLGIQRKSGLDIQRENHREQLRLRVYDEFCKAHSQCSEKNLAAGMYAFLIPMNLKIYNGQMKTGNEIGLKVFKPSPIKDRAVEFSRLHHEAQASTINIIRLIEKYEIMVPEFNIFKLAINVANFDMRNTCVNLHEYLLRILPMDIVLPDGESRVVNVKELGEEQLKKLDALVDKYKSASDDLTCYLYDLNVELQNVFLSKLFNGSVSRRKPLDPEVKVITTESENIKQLRNYFENETDFGKDMQRTNERVKSQLGNSYRSEKKSLK